ncbi:GreA/GreB family elongation factor [Candidatus Giovannonibacteria bacterium]|nr:GreA/GreB family elongation factor [Candidatus Giovannonibacteria bacterium]
MNDAIYFTKRGIEKLKKEIRELTKKLEDLQHQTAHVAEVGGDQYHDNASYEMLVIDIRGIDNRLAATHSCLNKAVVVEPPSNTDLVAIGTCVRIMRDEEETTWEIVGFGESDPDRNLLAYNTPLASLIIGKCQGEIVNGTIAGKQTKIEILEISRGGGDESTK